jgi:hypothetical protein
MRTVQRTRTDDDRRPDGFGPPILVTHPSRHIPRALLLAVLAVLVVGAGCATAASTKSTKHSAPCWKTLINDWYDGRIDGTYPIHCYREALDHLPTDVETYSSARDDIKQALEERITQSHTQGGSSGGTGSGGTGGGTKGTGGKDSGGTGSGGSGTKGNGPIGNAIKGIGPSKADSVPVPLIVLGGVALLLMALGGAGFLARRVRTRKLQLASAASLPPAGPEQPGPRS